MSDLLTPVRHAVRALLATPATSALAVATMAAAIGANAAVFTVVNATVLRDLPFPDARELVLVTAEFPRARLAGMALSGPEGLEFPEIARGFSGSGMVLFDTATVAGRTEPVRARTAYTSASALEALGTPPLVGRPYSPEEDRPGAPRVALLGHALWVRAFGSDPAVVGQAITIDGLARTIVGVMPPSFDLLGAHTELWLPLRLDPATPPSRDDHRYRLVARLATGVTLDQARGELQTALGRWRQVTGRIHSPDPRMHPLALTPLLDASVGSLRGTMLLMLGAVGFVLLMACANVSNLLLARAEARRHEIAVRLALGASRWRLLREHMVEGLCLAAAGSVAGLLLASALLRVMLAEVVTLPRVAEVHLDGAVLLFTLGLTALAGVLFGMVPVVRLDAARAFQWLKGDSRGTTGSIDRQRLQRVLVTLEVALALMLLIGAGVMLRGFWRLAHVNPGFDPAGVVTMEVSLPSMPYESNEQVWDFYDQLIERTRAAGASQAGLLSGAMPQRRPNNTTFMFEGMPTLTHDTMPQVDFIQHVSEGTFPALGLRMLEGRALEAGDRENSLPVAVVNQTLAQKFWPGQSAIGQRFRPMGMQTPWFTVVGVVQDVKQAGLHAPPGGEVFVTHRQALRLLDLWLPRDLTLVAKVDAGRMREFARRLPAIVHEMDASLAISRISSMDDAIGRTIAEPRTTAMLLGGFAVAALLLASLGIYGVISFAVGQRTGEFAVRIALGATPSAVVRLVLAQAALPVVVGLAAGFAGSIATTRVLKSFLFEITPTDPPTVVAVLLFLATIAVAACWIPARRATRVDPIEALRNV